MQGVCKSRNQKKSLGDDHHYYYCYFVFPEIFLMDLGKAGMAQGRATFLSMDSLKNTEPQINCLDT